MTNKLDRYSGTSPFRDLYIGVAVSLLIISLTVGQFSSNSNNITYSWPLHEVGGRGGQKVLNVCFCLDILGKITKSQKSACVQACFGQDCLKVVVNK